MDVSFEHDAIKFPIEFIDTSFIEFFFLINFNGRFLGFKLNIKIFPSSLPVITCFL